MPDPYKIYGGPGSPYSHKIRSLFRYRRISHTWTIPQGEFSGAGSLGSDQPGSAQSDFRKAGKSVVPVVKYPDGTYKADSTPIIFDLEDRHKERSILPPNKGIAFLAHLIEDMADEFLPMPMFYYRWTDDKEWCSRRQMAGWMGAISDDDLDSSAKAFLDRQFAQLSAGIKNLDPDRMKKAYAKFLTVMEAQLKKELFLFGTRPSIAEFGLYGQLTQYAVDPKVCNWMKKDAVRTYQWTHLMDDLSGIEGQWYSPEKVLTPELEAMLTYVSEFYMTMAQLVTQFVGTEDLGDGANGMKYRVKTFLDLKRELAELDEADIQIIRPILMKTGCWERLQFKDAERERAIPIQTV
jgi:glutathione S-transferase